MRKRLARATARKLAAHAEWEQAIRDAAAAGMSLREIAAVAGCSHEQVRKIVRSQG